MDTRLWFAREDSIEHAVALRVCRACPVRGACLADVHGHEDDPRYVVGLYGGVPASRRRAGC
jgi:hypothetical protein